MFFQNSFFFIISKVKKYVFERLENLAVEIAKVKKEKLAVFIF